MPRVRVKGTSVQTFAKRLKALPRTVAQDVARQAAPMMTAESRASFNAGRTVYDDPRPRGVGGQELSLEQSGAIKAALRFTNEGTRVRAVLGPRDNNGVQYGKFLIGKYNILPNGPIPLKWRGRLGEIFRATAGKKVRGDT
jgi:hypothetical protein